MTLVRKRSEKSIIIKNKEKLNKAIQITILKIIRNNEFNKRISDIYDLLSVYVESNNISYNGIASEIEYLRTNIGDFAEGYYEV